MLVLVLLRCGSPPVKGRVSPQVRIKGSAKVKGLVLKHG